MKFLQNSNNDRLKVAIVPHPQNVFPPPSGSVAKVVWESAWRLAPACEVTIFSRRDPEQQKFSRVEGVNIRRLAVTFDEKLVYRVVDRLQRYLGWEKEVLFRFYLYFWFMVKTAIAIRRSGSQIVHIHNYSQFVPIIRFFNPRRKIILHMHCHWLVENDFKTIYQRAQKADCIISPSASITEQTRRRFPDLAAKCLTVPNGVDTQFFARRNGEALQAICQNHGFNGKNVVLFVGRITPEKGAHLLIEAMGVVAKSFPDTILVLVGGKFLTPISARVKTDAAYQRMEEMKRDYSGYLNNLIERHNLSVVFTGYKPAAELVHYYSLATVVVLPSYEEAGPLPVLEAMACQAPMVATAVDGIADYLPPQAGFLVPPDDVPALAQKIIRCLNNREERETMGRHGRQYVEAKFTWDHMAENLRSVYFDLLTIPS